MLRPVRRVGQRERCVTTDHEVATRATLVYSVASAWHLSPGASNGRSNPMSFVLDGRQRVVMSAGNALFVLSLP